MLFGELAEGLEVAGSRRDQAHVAGDRLEQNCGHLTAVMVQEIGDGGGIIERTEQRVLCGAWVTPGLLGTPSVVAAEPAWTSRASMWP